MLHQGCELEANPRGFRGHFLADTHTSKLKGRYRAIKKRCILLVKFLAWPVTNNLILNIELAEIKVTVIINQKWHNLDYPCYPVGRPHVMFPVTTKHYIP